MKPERYQQIKEIFLAAADLESGKRAAYLDDACGEDNDLRAEVESLLAEHEKASASEPTIKADSSKSDEDLPPSIGPYRIVSQIGRGGMGVVYLGVREDGQFKRRVAIKVVKKGMDTEEILARFDLERQLLASLNHANIARLYEGDVTEDGRPYFVLEFIDGVPIDQYCDEHRLTIKERLVLFATVCEAVQYAHQNLVVHRDLKPGNILVTEDGTPKLLDFGIAKLLNPELALLVKDPTAPGLRLMTPEYASPEQVRGTTISTASDVYSLGVLLYELLTGHRPYRITSHIQAELERIICEVEPERPSTAINQTEEIEEEEIDRSGESTTTTRTVTPDTVSRARGGRIDRLSKQLAGDLDNIVFMAMRKEPQRRYSSAKQLAEDIQRHLDSLPVIARPDNLPYRFRKFTTRNRGPVAAAVVIVFLLVGGITTTAWQANEAEKQRDKALLARDAEAEQRAAAEEYFSEAISLSDFFMKELDSEIDQRGATQARKEMADRALESLQNLSGAVHSNDTIARQLANMHSRVGDVQGGIRSGNVGDIAASLKSYEQSLAIRTELLSRSPDDSNLLADNIVVHLKISDVLRQLGDDDEARNHVSAAAKLLSRLPEDIEQYPREIQRLRATVLISVADDLSTAKQLPAAKLKYEESMNIREQILKDIRAESNPDPVLLRRSLRDVSVILSRMANVAKKMNHYDIAHSHLQRMLGIRRDLLEQEPENRRYIRDLYNVHLWMGQVYGRQGNYDSEVEQYETYARLASDLNMVDPSDFRVRKDVALAHLLVGNALMRNNLAEEARRALEKAIAYFAELQREQPDNASIAKYLAQAHEIFDQISDSGN